MAPSRPTLKDVVIILQARINSKRFPGKVMKDLQGIPMLSHCIRRLKNVCNDVPVIVATSNSVQDNAIVKLAEMEGVQYFRGLEENVLDRFYKASKKNNARIIIRATGDNPLVDQVEARRVLKTILRKEYQYVAGFHEVDGLELPFGVGIEAFTFEALEEVWKNGTSSEYREHINEYIFDNSKNFKSYDLKCLPENSCPELRLTVDTQEEFKFVEKIGYALGNIIDLSTSEIIRWWRNAQNDDE